jgi:hypothetical protein
MFRNHKLHAALRDCHRQIASGVSIEDCIEAYPQFAAEIRAHFGLMHSLSSAGVSNPPASVTRKGRGLVLSAVAAAQEKESAMFGSTFSKVLAGLVAGFLIGSMTLGAGAATETVQVNGPVGDLLANLGVQRPQLPAQEPEDEEEEDEDEDEAEPEEDENEEDENDEEDEPNGGPGGGGVDIAQGPGTGHETCFAATEHARSVIQALLDGSFFDGLDLPPQAQPGLDDVAGLQTSLAAIENCGMGADGNENGGGPPEGVGGPPEGIGGARPEGVGGGRPEGVGGGPPEGIGGGRPEGVGGPPSDIQQGPPSGDAGPPSGIGGGPPSGIGGGPPGGAGPGGGDDD